MLKQLVFATSNKYKIDEVKAILGDQFEIVSLSDIGCQEDIPETSPDFEGNALQKARYVKQHYGLDCFAEDTGLEVEALNGEPGVYTARYAGPERSEIANMELVLQKLQNQSNRKARFRTVMALILNGKEWVFEGQVEGLILEKRTGSGGFGYDPIFQPKGYDSSFAEMDAAIKNSISHRGRALKKLITHLNKNHNP